MEPGSSPAFPSSYEIERDLGRVWRAQAVCFKPYSCCGSNHSSIDAALDLMADHGFNADNVRRVIVGVRSSQLRAIGQIIGQHHAHLVPKGLPGAWNLLVFDNGGASGYGFANPIAPDGKGAFVRPTSRVLEIDPVALKLVWSYANPRFFSTNISSAQRLPNGNTLITAGAGGRVFEVTVKGDIVWEYMYPLFGGANRSNAVYRAYRVPYGWIPQLTVPGEQRVTPPALGEFKVP